MKNVLVKHKQLLDPAISIDEPVKVVGQKRGIIDLMLSRATRRHRADEFEHLVVELKAPRVKIGADEINQIRKYALAVRTDERFHSVKGVRWHFWVISNDLDELGRETIDTGVDPECRLIARGPNFTVGVKTWGELIDENRARLQFFQEQMQHTVSESQAMAHLQERYSKFLEGVVVEAEEDDPAAGGTDHTLAQETTGVVPVLQAAGPRSVG